MICGLCCLGNERLDDGSAVFLGSFFLPDYYLFGLGISSGRLPTARANSTAAAAGLRWAAAMVA